MTRYVATTRCTGLTAFWCPTHGGCICLRHEDGLCPDMDSPSCPLHGSSSAHPARAANTRLKRLSA